MRRKRAEFEIFNLSFLDVISCGFGAVVLLVLALVLPLLPLLLPLLALPMLMLLLLL